MTKLKNTKKGMAKKALSISLVAAMLATSNVPVWAAEDLFTDGSAAVEAPVVEEPAAEVDVFSAEPAEVEEAQTAAPLADNEDVTVDIKIVENGWGYDAVIDNEHCTITGLASNETNVMYYWTVNGLQVTQPAQVAINNISALKFNPSKEYCNGSLALVVYRPDNWSTPFTWTSDSVVISKRDINKENMTNISVITKMPTYDGKEHKDANEWISSITFGVDNTELTYANGDFTVEVTGSNGLVNADSDISISIQPKDTAYYTGQKVVTTENGADQGDKLQISPKNYEVGDIKVEYIGGDKVFNGDYVEFKNSDFQITDTLSGEVIDSDDIIWKIYDNDNKCVNAGEYTLSVGLLSKGSANYTDLTNVTVSTSNKLNIKKLDLSTCDIFLGTVQANDKGDAVTAANLSTIKITDSNGKVVYNDKIAGSGFNVTNVQANNGTAGRYTATVEVANSNTNYTGKSTTAYFRVYKNALAGAEFKGEESSTGQWLSDEEYTGEAIVKDPEKLGTLTASNGTKLTAGVDYDTNFVYKNNTNAGTASFIVKGLNSYAGSELTFYYTINKAEVKKEDVKAAEKVTFNENYTKAEEYAPSITVIGKNGATPAKEFTLVNGTDYSVEYTFASSADGKTFTDVPSNGNKLGNYVHAKITITNNNFKGGDTVFDVYTEITKPQVSNWTVSTVSPSYTYTGEAIIPELIVKDGTKELEQDVDYVVKSISSGTNVGTATITLAGKGDYDPESTITTTFEITPASTEDLVVNIKDQAYTGQRIRPTASDFNSVKLGDVNISLNQFTISYPDSADANKEIGTGTLTLTPKTTNKNFVGTKEVTFNIVGKQITASDSALKVYDENGNEIDLSSVNELYDGKEHTFARAEFSYIYKDETTGKSVTLEEGKDFEIKYFHNVYGEKSTDNATYGTAYIAVVGKGNYAGTKKITDENGKDVYAMAYKTFKISSIELTDQNITVSNGVYAEGMPVKPVITVTYGRDTIALEEGKDYTLDIKGVYTEPTTSKKYSVQVTGINGYTGGTSKAVKWGIDKKDLADCDVTATRDDAGNVTVTVMNGSVVVDSSKYVITTDAANDTVTVTPAADSKYYTGSAVVAIQGEDPAEKPAAPEITEVKVNGNNATVVLSGESDGATGYDYVISTDRDCINNKDYDKVNKNILSTQATFTYTQQGVYYAYCHAWKRVDGVKVFSEWSNAYPFVVSAITPEQPVITSVKKSGRNLTVTWTQSENATTGYDIVMGTAMRKVNGEMRPVEYGKAVKKVGPNTFSVTFKSIPKGTYYVGLHAHNRTSETGVKVFSPWSNAKKVTF